MLRLPPALTPALTLAVAALCLPVPAAAQPLTPAERAAIERAVTALGLSQIAFEGSDSLDAPDAVFQ